MNKKKKIIIIIISALILLIYLIFLIYGISKTNHEIKSIKKNIDIINNKIKTEIKNKKIINNTDKEFLQNAYFDREGDYFENYIRNLFEKYKTQIKIYHSNLSSQDYAEMSVSFKISAFNFFNLIKEIENGKRLVVIQNINITRDDYPNFNVRMTLGAYYK